MARRVELLVVRGDEGAGIEHRRADEQRDRCADRLEHEHGRRQEMESKRPDDPLNIALCT